MQTFVNIILVSCLILFTASSVYAQREENMMNKLNIKLTQYYNQKKYEAVIMLGNKMLQLTERDENQIEQYLLNAYKQHIEALILTRQAGVLYNNQQILQARKTIDQAETMSPETEIIQNLKTKIYKNLEVDPLSHLSSADKLEFEKLLTSAGDALDKGKNDEALGLFAKTLLLAPRSLEAIEGYNLALVRTNKANASGRTRELLARAEQLIQEKKYTDAVNTLDEVLSLDPINTYAIDKKNKLNELIKSISQSAQKEELAKEYLDGAKQHENKNEFAQAIEKYNLGLGLLPDYAPWKKLIAAAEKKQKENEEQKFSKSLDDIAKSYQKGIYYLAAEEFSRAITEFENVINISKTYGQQQTIQQAEEFLQKARDNFKRKEEEVVSETNPYFKMINNAKIMGINAYNHKQYEIAKKYFGSILELFPKNKIARIYFIRSDIELLPGSKTKIIEEFVTDIEAAMEKDPVEAKRLLSISEQIDPDNPAIKNLSEKINKNKNQNIIRKATVPAEVLNNWYQQAFTLLTQQNDSVQANELLTKIINADPTYIKAITLKARIEGRTQVTATRAVAPEAQKYYSEGLWHYGQGRIQEARNSFEQALKIEPTYQNAKNAREKCIKYLQQTGGG